MTDLADHPKAHQLRQVVVRLDMVSHAKTLNWSPVVSQGKNDGGGRPSGGLVRKDDWQEDYRQKSGEYFRRRAKRVETEAELGLLLAEAEATVEAWRRAPASPGVDVPNNILLRRCVIAEDTRDISTVASFYGVSRSTVKRYRQQYRGLLRREVWTNAV